MSTKRQQKFSRMLQREMGDMFQRDFPHLFQNSLISVTEVDVSPDLGFAKFYLSIIQTGTGSDVMGAIEDHKSEIRRVLGNRIGKHTRVIPELAFFHDKTVENAMKMDKLLNSLDIPPEEPNNEED